MRSDFYALLFLGLCCVGCNGAPQQPTESAYPPVLPIWIVEDDPNTTIFAREDLKRDRKVGKMLVIPLYKDYRHEGKADSLAIAHPFVYEQGNDIEKHLSSFEQRDRLRRLIFWVPGYFPDGLGRTPSWTPIIQGKRMIVKELQRCVGSEEREINAAMKTLLLDEDFVVGKKIILRVPPMHHDPANLLGELRTAIEPYDASLVVRSMEYNGRFYNNGGVLNIHVLWAFSPGTQIINRLSDEEKKTVAAFASQLAKHRKEEGPPKQDQAPSKGH
jgi:hypothetical protein